MPKDQPVRSETVLYFVRHGQTEYNRRRVVQGRGIDSRLNATGRAQADALAERLSAVPFDAIYTSTLRRAEETAQILAARHEEAPLHRLEDLEEMAWGIYEGEPATGNVLEAFNAIKAAWRSGAFGRTIEGGESILDVQRRALRALDHILTHHAGQTVLVVTHGRFLRVLLASLLEEYGLERMHEVRHDNTAVNCLSVRGEVCEARLLNCTAHLDAAA